MQKIIPVLVAISIVLGGLLAAQVSRSGLELGPVSYPPFSAAQTSQAGPTAINSSLSMPVASVQGGNVSAAILDAQSALLNQVFKDSSNSVVQITSKVTSVVPNIIINGNPFEQKSTRLGSGFVYDSDGKIITNNHVVEGAKTVDVTFVDGNTYSAKVVGTDAFSDLAVLQITDDFSSEAIKPLVLDDSSQLQVGQQVIAIGNPFGLSDTMTSGIVSQVGRLLPNEQMGFSIPDAIQTDAAINPGNSGGPLLDIQGRVIGVNTAIRSSTGDFAGIGFAIPSNTVARIVPHLVNEGKYDHPWLGIAGASLNPDLAEQLGLPRDFKGVAVSSVSQGGPAENAGLKGGVNGGKPAGDIITALDSHPVKRIEDLILYIDEHTQVGSNVVITVYRDGQYQDLSVTLGARPAPVQTS